MPYKLECAQDIATKNATEEDIHRAFDDNSGRGEYIILFATDDRFIQAAGEDDGPYVLEYCDGDSEKHFRAAGELNKEDVRAVFVSYINGGDEWKKNLTWELAPRGGCLGSILVLVALCSGSVLGLASL